MQCSQGSEDSGRMYRFKQQDWKVFLVSLVQAGAKVMRSRRSSEQYYTVLGITHTYEWVTFTLTAIKCNGVNYGVLVLDCMKIVYMFHIKFVNNSMCPCTCIWHMYIHTIHLTYILSVLCMLLSLNQTYFVIT